MSQVSRSLLRARRLKLEPLESRRVLAVVPTGFSDSIVADNLTSPVTMDIADDGRVFVAFQDGRIGVIENDSLNADVFAVLDTDGSGERGLQGLELDPDFANNGYLYVYYTAASPASHNRVSRLTVDPATGSTMLAGSEQVLLELPDLSTVSNPIWHMGGAVDFLHDGTLVAQVGDHQAAQRSQNLDEPFGKVLRMNVDGTPATDNPYFNPVDGITYRDYVWSWGLRNPFSGDVDPESGRYFINDVGAGSWEEINEATASDENFGWPTTEGNFNQNTFPNLTLPVHAYSHGDGCAVTGGAFYPTVNAQFPAEYQGKYFFSEFCASEIRVIDPDNGAQSTDFATGAGFPMNIEVGPDGSLYYISRGAGAGGAPGIGTGEVRKIQYVANVPPTVSSDPHDVLVSIGQDATFSASAFGTDPLSYQWQRLSERSNSFVDIAGATGPQFTLANALLADDGARFRVRVANAYGSDVSE
ncbi:MAG: PQQ-dependent sugar dehydrogenase, partial [Planctomycetales bacterium]|nr:PQQ-dependent sugar dehydrogenase [Planctomycetales bacterium]